MVLLVLIAQPTVIIPKAHRRRSLLWRLAMNKTMIKPYSKSVHKDHPLLLRNFPKKWIPCHSPNSLPTRAKNSWKVTISKSKCRMRALLTSKSMMGKTKKSKQLLNKMISKLPKNQLSKTTKPPHQRLKLIKPRSLMHQHKLMKLLRTNKRLSR